MSLLLIPFGYVIYRLSRQMVGTVEKIVFASALFHFLGGCSDIIRYYSFIGHYQFNVIFFDRYESPILLLLALIYLVNQLSRETIESLKLEAFEEAASQFVHDIQSPIAALKMAKAMDKSPPSETSQLMSYGITRVVDICSSLKNYSYEIQRPLPSPLRPLIEKLLQEKRVQFQNKPSVTFDFSFDERLQTCSACLQPAEFTRILSNLINNAVESFGQSGRVSLEMKRNRNVVELAIKDNGSGIPANILQKLGHRGMTVGKEGGSGLGLYHAKKTLKQWGGTLKIVSQINRGTVVTLTLPYSDDS
jgi:signal transduction histidine kinase